jgi:hypothetical protein
VPLIDHAFTCTARGAPAAQLLIDFGLTEGPPDAPLGPLVGARRSGIALRHHPQSRR